MPPVSWGLIMVGLHRCTPLPLCGNVCLGRARILVAERVFFVFTYFVCFVLLFFFCFCYIYFLIISFCLFQCFSCVWISFCFIFMFVFVESKWCGDVPRSFHVVYARVCRGQARSRWCLVSWCVFMYWVVCVNSSKRLTLSPLLEQPHSGLLLLLYFYL